MKWFWKIYNELFLTCWKCDGSGKVQERGRRLTREEAKARTTPAEYADWMVQGGWFYEPVEKECPKCGGSGVRR